MSSKQPTGQTRPRTRAVPAKKTTRTLKKKDLGFDSPSYQLTCKERFDAKLESKTSFAGGELIITFPSGHCPSSFVGATLNFPDGRCYALTNLRWTPIVCDSP